MKTGETLWMNRLGLAFKVAYVMSLKISHGWDCPLYMLRGHRSDPKFKNYVFLP